MKNYKIYVVFEILIAIRMKLKDNISQNYVP